MFGLSSSATGPSCLKRRAGSISRRLELPLNEQARDEERGHELWGGGGEVELFYCKPRGTFFYLKVTPEYLTV